MNNPNTTEKPPSAQLLATGLPASIWNGRPWIWATAQIASRPNTYAEFQLDVDVHGSVAGAWIALAADTSYRLRVNGDLVFHGSLREIAPYFYYDVIDLAPQLVQGKNRIRILAHHQGVSCGFHEVTPAGVLIAGEIRAGQTISLSGGTAWKARLVRSYRQDSHRLGAPLGFSEHVDFSVAEAPWGNPVIVGRHPCPDRPIALARDLPALVGETFSVVRVQPLGEGLLCDFGQELFGFIDFVFESEKAGDLELCYAEHLTDGVVDHRKQQLDYRDVLTAPAGRQVWRSYEKRAFRYLYLSRPVKIHDLQVTEAHYPYEHSYANAAAQRDPLVNRILQVSARTIELCSDDLLNDCPWRERAQYFDCFHYVEAMQKLFGTLAPIKRFLSQYARGANAEGGLRMSYPSPANHTVIPDFAMAYAVQLDLYLSLSGDLETAATGYLYARQAVRQFRNLEDADGLLANVPGWIFLDNGFELRKYPRSAALNAVYAGAHRALAQVARRLGKAAEADACEADFQRIRRGFRKIFWTGERILDADSSPEFESYQYWNYHHSAESGRWSGGSFTLQTTIQWAQPGEGRLRFMCHGGGRVWVDGRLTLDVQQGGSWVRAAVFEPQEVQVPADGQPHALQVEVEFSAIEWEFFISSREKVMLAPCRVWESAAFSAASAAPAAPPAAGVVETRMRPYFVPRLSQVTTGYSIYHGMLDAEEARALLRRCLPEDYYSPYAKRTTPFFVKTTDDAERLRTRVVPCNVPASLFYFCHALQRHGMAEEARKLLLPIYGGMLERGATSWWEEWERRSSHCHGWSSFAAVFFLSAT